MEKFGNCINRLRKERELKVYELANKVGITPEFITQIEKGRRYPNILNLEKLSHILGEELKTLYFKEHRPDILAMLGKNMVLPKTPRNTRKTKK